MNGLTNPIQVAGSSPIASTGADSGLGLLVDELSYGVVVTDLQGRVLQVNQAARRELGRRPGLSLHGSITCGRTAGDGRTLLDALAKAGDGKRSLITLAGASGPSLTLAVIPLRPDGGSNPARAALVFARACVCDSLMLGFFARTHGLTHSEENVLGILCQGYSAPEVAAQLKVAVSTVRSHVRSLCAKTQASGVRDLVVRVAVLPPVAPALWHQPMH